MTPLEIAVSAMCLLALVAVFLVTAHGPFLPEAHETLVVRVEASQSLWEIASLHPVEGLSTAQTVDLIRTINQLKGSSLREGDILRLPIVRDASAYAGLEGRSNP